jgi:hypothetical protein
MATKKINICIMILFCCKIRFNFIKTVSKYFYNISNFFHFCCQFTVILFLDPFSRSEVSKPYNVLLLRMDCSFTKDLELHYKTNSCLATSDAICHSIK